MAEEIKNGRPFLFTDPAKLKVNIQAYFDMQDPHVVSTIKETGYSKDGKTIFMEREEMTEQEPYTVSGLARHLGVTRQTLRAYRKKEHYSEEIPEEIQQELINTIGDAFLRVEEYAERQLYKPGIANGAKFNLTNNFEWVDKQVIDNNNRTVAESLDDLEDPQEQRDNIATQAAAALNPTPPKDEVPSDGSTPQE